MYEFDIDIPMPTDDFELFVGFERTNDNNVTLMVDGLSVTTKDAMVIIAYLTAMHAKNYADNNIRSTLYRIDDCYETAKTRGCFIFDMVENDNDYFNIIVKARNITIINHVHDQDDLIIMICGMLNHMRDALNHEPRAILEHMLYYGDLVEQMAESDAFIVLKQYVNAR